MSGTNPFRRRENEIYGSHASKGEARDPLPDTSQAQITAINTDLPRPVKIGKTVRIISPHSAGSDPEDEASFDEREALRGRPTSPPPVSSSPRSSKNEATEDPFGAGSDGDTGTEDERMRQNTRLNAGSPSKFADAFGLPENPFKKALITLERSGTSGDAVAKSEVFESTKPHYDVDDFKRLLLKGAKQSTAASTAAPPSVSFHTQSNVGDNSSSTDASSISRQSLFESISGNLHETPRTSQELNISDDERQRLMGTSPTKADKVRPSTPAHRHGKLVRANAPQTVPFEDPTLSNLNNEVAAVSRSGRSGPTSPRTPGNVQKPLPALPSSFSSEPTRDHLKIATSIISSYPETPESEVNPSFQAKNAPAPPPLSRHSQRRPKSFVSNSDRTSPISEEMVASPAVQSQSSPSSNSKPAPPPPRRSGTYRQDSSSSIPTTASIAGSSDQSLQSTQALPPTPPTRSPSLAATKRPSQTSPSSGSPSMPPPPPPRRRGSSQSSYSQSKLSGDYRNAAEQRLRSDSGASSISQLQMTPVEPVTEKKDVLADLSALQREVDELRGKFRH